MFALDLRVQALVDGQVPKIHKRSESFLSVNVDEGAGVIGVQGVESSVFFVVVLVPLVCLIGALEEVHGRVGVQEHGLVWHFDVDLLDAQGSIRVSVKVDDWLSDGWVELPGADFAFLEAFRRNCSGGGVSEVLLLAAVLGNEGAIGLGHSRSAKETV